MDQYEHLARALAASYMTGDISAIREINWNNGTSFAWEREPIDLQRRLVRWFGAQTRTDDLALADERRRAGAWGRIEIFRQRRGGDLARRFPLQRSSRHNPCSVHRFA